MERTGAKRILRGLIIILCGLLNIFGLSALGKKEYQVIIAMDTVSPWSEGIRDGFKETLEKQLAASGATVRYQVFDTKLDPKTIPGIQAAIDATKPDLICTINYPTVFADNMITRNPANSGYNFVSENCIPLQSGLINDLKKPGGNVTGVGVFLQMNSMIRLAKMINPKVKKLAVTSWDAMTQVNEWFEIEFKRACREEGIELAEFRRVSCIEDELAFYEEYDKKGRDYFVTTAISAFVHRDGRPADAVAESSEAIKKLKQLLFLTYDETPIRTGTCTAGPSVVWYDIGAQLAEKGFKVLNGTKPGDLSWDYPRKYNIILNLFSAKRMGYTFSDQLRSAAYRIYTDLEGNFVGQSK